jgi:hypothetical protein
MTELVEEIIFEAMDQAELIKVCQEQKSINKKRPLDVSEKHTKRRKIVEESNSNEQIKRKETRRFVQDSKCLALDFHYDFEDSRYSGGSDYGNLMRSVAASPLQLGIESPIRLGGESPSYSSMSSPAHTSIDQEIETEMRNGDDTDDDNLDIWKSTDDILSRVEASLSNFTKKTNIGISKLAVESKTSPIKTKPQRRSRSKKKEDSRKSPTNPESGKENADSNDPGESVKYVEQVPKIPSSLLKNDSSRQEKVLHKAEASYISTDNQIPPGSKRKRIANRKYINDEFDDSPSPRRNKINTSISSTQRNDKTDEKTNMQKNNLGKVVITQKTDSVSLKAKTNNTIVKDSPNHSGKNLLSEASKSKQLPKTIKPSVTSQTERKRSLKEEFVMNNKKPKVTNNLADKETRMFNLLKITMIIQI